MKIEPVRYKRLIMQLMTPTPIKALRQARSASPSSERRTGAAAINPYLFKRIKGTCRFYRCFGTSSIGVALTIQFTPHEAGGDETPRWAAHLIADTRRSGPVRALGRPERDQNHGHQRPAPATAP